MRDEKEKGPRGEAPNGNAYILQVSIGNKVYCLVDLQCSLSSNIQDSMVFLNNLAAESYAGAVEHLIETQTGMIATTHVTRISLSGIIPKTAIECIPSPGNHD